MKKSFKVIYLVLTICILLSSTNVCFARNYDDSLDVKEYVQNSNYYVADNSTLDGITIDRHINLTAKKIKNDGNTQLASGGQDASHQFVTAQAINIINNDKGYDIARYLIDYKYIIAQYSDMPDTDEKDYAFAYHFYNPYTGRNYLPSDIPASLETALVRFVKHAEAAKENYSTNKEYAMEELGRACHYLADANEPHHASNLIAGLSYHSQFESFVNGRNEQYKVTTSSKYNVFSSNSSYGEYCTLLCDDSAKFAYGYKDLANASKGLLKGGDQEKWDIAARAIMKNAQESIAAFLYNFLKSVEKI